MSATRELTIKQKQFVDFYLSNGNATQAYKMVYGKDMGDNTAGVNANRTLKLAKVQEYIKQKQPEIQKKIDFTVDWLREEVYKVILDERSRPNDKLKGYEILGKTLGAFVEKREVSTPKDEDFVIVVKNEEDTV